MKLEISPWILPAGDILTLILILLLNTSMLNWKLYTTALFKPTITFIPFQFKSAQNESRGSLGYSIVNKGIEKVQMRPRIVEKLGKFEKNT